MNLEELEGLYKAKNHSAAADEEGDFATIGSNESPHFPAKTVVCFLGLPGAGKSTQIDTVKESTGASVYHVGKFARIKGLSEHDETIRREGKLLEGHDEAFIEHALSDPNRIIILDGFPRSVQQAELLLEALKRTGIALKVMNMDFGAQGVRLSYARQTSRAAQSAIDRADDTRYLGKIQRAIDQDLSAIQYLKQRGAAVNDIDAMQSQERIAGQINDALHLKTTHVPFNTTMLRQLKEVADELGIEAWAACGSVYRPFWNDIFGAKQNSTDVDISTNTQEEAIRLQEALERKYPDTRWSTWGIKEYMEQEEGVPCPTLADAIMHAPLTFRQSAVRLGDSGEPELIATKAALRSLISGKIVVDPAFTEGMSDDERTQFYKELAGHARKVIRHYPGLSIGDSAFAHVYAEAFGAHEPKRIFTGYADLHRKVEASEAAATVDWPQSHVRHIGLNDRERELAERIADFYRHAEKESSAVPIPKPVALPEPLEEARRYKRLKEYGQPITA